jgi:type IV secretory pathway VirB4 component
MAFGKKPEKSKDDAAHQDNKQTLSSGSLEIKDIIAPSAIEVDFDHIKIGPKFFRTIFVSGYPRFVGANWLEPIINFDHSLLISMFYYPIEARGVLDDLRRKIAEMEATLSTDKERGRVVDPAVQAALDDANSLQEQLVKGMERFFQFSFYITITADSHEELVRISTRIESALGSLMLISKHATLQMEEAFQSTIPACLDKLFITRNMDTTSVATTFPFTSSELSANDGILYGINKHNGSLIIFDRFSLENANSVIFAKSGSGKSYFVKIEILRSLLFGSEIIVIDPENEYKKLCEALGGDYIDFSINSASRINPFDLPEAIAGSEESKDVLGLKILTLHTLFKIMLGNLTPTEEAVLDNALVITYKLKGITQDPATQTKEPPVMQDLYKVLLGMEEPEAKGLSDRLERYIKGSLAGIFDQRSTIKIKNVATVFSVQQLEDILRPIAIYIILDFVWTKIRSELKRRIMVVDEAWYLMQNPDSAEFLYSIAKRARKYYLGLTTITQDVSDFLDSRYGKAIITNSSMQMLLRQHPAAIDQIAEVFYLSEGEKRLLLSAGVGEGIFFAGSNHVAIQVVASEYEHKLVTTNPAEIIKMQDGEEESKVEKLKKRFAEIKLKSEPALPHNDNLLPSRAQKVQATEPQAKTAQVLPPNHQEPPKTLQETVR